MASSLRSWLLQSPPVEWGIQWLRDMLVSALRQGPIPRHIAFVMDGNRRYARQQGIETIEGHHRGFEALGRILEVCYKAGVQTVTIYAFSIENFKRSKYEVDALMEIAKTRAFQLAQHNRLLARYGAAIRVLGDRSLLRPDVNEVIDEVIEMTKDNTSAVLNVCFSYTARDEITRAIRSTVADYADPTTSAGLSASARRPFSPSHIRKTLQARRPSTILEEQQASAGSTAPDNTSTARKNDTARSTTGTSSSTLSPPEDEGSDSLSSSTTLNPTTLTSNGISSSSDDETCARDGFIMSYPDPETITPQTLTNHMFTAGDPPLDLFIRTSGVERLSDFLLWQCHENTRLVFVPCLWPAFDLWKFLPVLWEWQHQQRKLLEVNKRLGRGRAVVVS